MESSEVVIAEENVNSSLSHFETAMDHLVEKVDQTTHEVRGKISWYIKFSALILVGYLIGGYTYKKLIPAK